MIEINKQGSFKFIIFLFYVYLFSMLAFGRWFAILHVKLPLVPLFVTEAILIVSLPLIIANLGFFLNNMPKKFKFNYIILIYFFYMSSLLMFSLMNKTLNLYGLRDIVLCGYLLFFPLAFIIFMQEKNLKKLFFYLVLSNIIAILIGLLFIYKEKLPLSLHHALCNLRAFNLGFYYGLTTSFLICTFSFLLGRKLKFFITLLISLNLAMLIMLRERSIWLATAFLLIFILIFLKNKLIRLALNLFPSCLLVFLFVLYVIPLILKTNLAPDVFLKAKSIILLPKIFSTPKAQDSQNIKGFKNYSVPTLPTLAIDQNLHWDNLSWRLMIWSQTIDFARKYYIFGVGFGIYPNYKFWWHKENIHTGIGINSGIIPTHNHLLTIFYKSGLIGLSLFLFINVYIFFYCITALKRMRSGLLKYLLIASLGAFIFWHILALFFNVIDSPSTSTFLWLISGMMMAFIIKDKKHTMLV